MKATKDFRFFYISQFFGYCCVPRGLNKVVLYCPLGARFCFFQNWLINFFLKEGTLLLLGTGKSTFYFTNVVYYSMATNIQWRY